MLHRLHRFLIAAGSFAAIAAHADAPAKFHLEEASIAQIQQAILAKQLTTEALVKLYLQRIKAYDGTCVKEPQGILGPITTIPNAGQLNSLATLNLRPATLKRWGFNPRKARTLTSSRDDDPKMPDALETAVAQDAELTRTGKLVGPLHGVVMSIKDQYDTFDMRTTSGGDVQYANDRPPTDATFIARLRAAGAIILAKSNLAEYASNGSRSAFGGTFCNPYDTERAPGMSSAGSATSVAANLVTCAIAEETGPSIRWPSAANNTVGISPTQELVSRHGMLGAGLNTRTGPVCRNVADAAKLLDVIAGYDPKDELTVFSVGRTPDKPYASYANAQRLDGLRIGVVREYMNKRLFTKADEQSIDLVNRALDDLRDLGAQIVDPGPEGALFQGCIDRYAPQYYNAAFIEQFMKDKDGKTPADQIAALAQLAAQPDAVPDGISLRNLGRYRVEGESRYMFDRYLAARGDANVRTHGDLIDKATFYNDPNFPDRKRTRETAQRAMVLDTAQRLQNRFALQLIVLQCMQEQKLDALTYPTTNIPPPKLTMPQEPTINDRSPLGWTVLGREGFPAITVPAGFTSEVWDRVRDPSAPKQEDGSEGTKLVGPIAAQLPVGIDFLARPFDEPTLLKIASAYELATKHRKSPGGFGPLRGEP